MKKLIFAAALFLGAQVCHADSYKVWKTTATTVTGSARLCGSVTGGRGILHSVVVSSAVAASGITLSNSSWTVTSTPTTGFISAAQVGSYVYDVVFSTGLFYSRGGTAGISIVYECY